MFGKRSMRRGILVNDPDVLQTGSKDTSLALDYKEILTGLKDRVYQSRIRAALTVNAELVLLYWEIGRVIVSQQENAAWGDSVVERLSGDLREEFPDMKGFSLPNIWRMRLFYNTYREMNDWLVQEDISTPSRENQDSAMIREIISTLSREITSNGLPEMICGLSWSHHIEICSIPEGLDVKYFYLTMSVEERWSVRELRRQIDSDLYTRFVSVKDQPELCLTNSLSPSGLPFKDHYVLDFLGLGEEFEERELRKAMLDDLRKMFLEFGRDFCLIGEECALMIGGETFHMDLLLYHRRLQCLVAVELKTGRFKPEYVGKMLFYLAGLDEQVRMPHEKPSIGLVLCKSANNIHVRLALTEAASKVGVATYRTSMPDEGLIRKRLKELPLGKIDRVNHISANTS